MRKGAIADPQSFIHACPHMSFVTEAEFDRVVDPRKMVKPYVAADGAAALAEV
jgi:hypothetical protein